MTASLSAPVPRDEFPQRFRDVHRELCALLGTDPEPVDDDADGVAAFGLVMDGRMASFVHERADDEGLFTVLLDLGEPPDDQSLDGWAVLLEVNFAWAGDPNHACFCHDPVHGRLALRLVFPLDVPLHVLTERLQAAWAVGPKWRETQRQLAQGEGGHPPMPPAVAPWPDAMHAASGGFVPSYRSPA